jgi:O-antigen ligase
LSLLWSIAPGLCLRRLVILGCTFLGALGIARHFNMRELSQLALVVTGTVVCIGVLAEIRLGTFRPWSGEYRFSGSVHPNTQGMYLAVLVLSAWGLGRSASRGRWACWLILGTALALLVLTKSRTGLAALLVSMAAVLMLQTSLRFKVLLGVFGGCVGGAALLALLLGGIDPLTDFRDAALLGRSEQTESFSGRTLIWPEVLYAIGKRAVAGHGYESFWTANHVDGMFEAVGWAVREAHCGSLEVLLGTGVVGLSLLLLVMLLALVRTSRCYLRQRDPTYGLPFGMIVFGLLDSTMESGLVFINLGTFLVACCVLRIACFGARQQNPAPPHGDPRAVHSPGSRS